MKNCLITGINGVVGSNLANILRKNYNWNIIGIASPKSLQKNHYNVNLVDKKEVDNIFSKIESCDIVIHCAAIIDLKQDPSELISTNVVGSLNALHLAKRIKAKQFIYISSIPVIGKIIDYPITEAHRCSPNTIYHLSKLQAEQALELSCGSEINLISLRLPSPIGVGMPERSFFPIILGRALRNEDIVITGDKRRRQNFLDIRDLSTAIFNISQFDNLNGLYNIASSETVSNIELAHTVVKKTNSKSNVFDFTEESSEYYEDWNVDTSKAKKDFNFEAKYKMKDSVDWIVKEFVQ